MPEEDPQVDFNLREPCRGCPFRKESAAGWLGEYTPESVISCLQHEVPFLCHTRIDYDDDEWKSKGPYEHCAGAMIMMRKLAKLPRNPEFAAAVQAVDRNHPDVFENVKKFLEHHK